MNEFMEEEEGRREKFVEEDREEGRWRQGQNGHSHEARFIKGKNVIAPTL
jgi:hypothetical protein